MAAVSMVNLLSSKVRDLRDRVGDPTETPEWKEMDDWLKAIVASMEEALAGINEETTPFLTR